MKIGSIKENLEIEQRIAVTPEIIKKYKSLDLNIILPKGYGEHLGISDKEFIVEGAEILDNDEKTKQWIGSFTVTNDTISIQNNGEEDVVLGIEFDGNGAQWDISNTITLAPGVVTDIPAIPPENGVSFTWLELKQGEVILHLVNHEV